MTNIHSCCILNVYSCKICWQKMHMKLWYVKNNNYLCKYNFPIATGMISSFRGWKLLGPKNDMSLNFKSCQQTWKLMPYILYLEPLLMLFFQKKIYQCIKILYTVYCGFQFIVITTMFHFVNVALLADRLNI